jgi:hypothetical protein
MSYHSVQIHWALTRLFAAYGLATTMPAVACETIDTGSRVAYQVTVRDAAQDAFAHVLHAALGEMRDTTAGHALLSIDDAGKILQLAYR